MIRFRNALCSALVLLCALYLAAMEGTAASEYTLAPGDAVELRIGDIANYASEVKLDSAGYIPAPLVGLVRIQGMTAADAAEKLRGMYESQEFFVAPDLSLVLVETAPVYVTGDVRSPGEFPYAERLTVEKAIALAGGMQNVLSAIDPQSMASDVRSQLTDAYVEYVAAELRSMRFESVLKGLSIFDYAPPVPLMVRREVVDQMLAAEQELLRVESDAAEETERSLRLQIADLESEIVIVGQRRDEFEGQIELQKRETARLSELAGRGLTNAAGLANSERQLSMSRSDRLEQVASLTRAKRQRRQLQLDLSEVASGRKQAAATGLRDARARAEIERARLLSAQARLQRAVTLQSIGDTFGLRGESRYYLSGDADGQAIRREVEPTTRLDPGDVVIVVAEPMGWAENAIGQVNLAGEDMD